MEAPWLSENLPEVIRADDNFVVKCPDIATDIQKNKLKFIMLVEKLGTILTDSNPKFRSQGIQVLAEVLHSLPQNFLNETELNYLATFFVDRLVDHYSVTPASLRGILSIAQMEHAPRNLAVRVSHAVFQHVECQSMKPEDRRCLYKMFRVFILNFTDELKNIRPDFVHGFMNAIDQEKDARNLIIIFEILPFFVKTFPLGHLREEMFEIISCYFPVDYRPEYSNSTITREDLAEALQSCLVASPDFAEFCIPLLVKKLDSKLKLAKMDAFKVLIAGCQIFTVESVGANLLDLWRIIQHEVLPGSDKDVRELGLSSLKAIIHMISSAELDKEGGRNTMAITTFVLNAGLNSLKEVELNLFLPAVQMMLTAAEASSKSCQEVSKKVLPVLVKQFYQENGTEQKVTVLRALTSFVAVCESQDVGPLDFPEVSTVWQEIPSLFLGAAQFDNIEVQREGFHGLAVSAKVLDGKSRETLYELLNRSMRQDVHDTIRSEIWTCLKEFSKIHTDEIVEKIIKILLKDIRACPENNEGEILLVLESLCEIADAEPFTSLIVPCILHLIIDSASLEKCNIGTKCLRRLLESTGESKIYNYLHSQCAVVSQLISWWLQGIVEERNQQIFENEEVLCDIAKIIDMIIKNQESGAQYIAVSELVPKIVKSNSSIDEESKCMLLNFSSPSKNNQVVILLESLIASVRQDVELPGVQELIVNLVQLAIHSCENLTQISACRLVANLMNKKADDEHFSALLGEIMVQAESTVNGSATCDEEKRNAVSLMVWVTKALVMRGHLKMDIWVETLISAMANSLVGTVAAQGFSLIMKDDVEYFNSSNFCNVRILFRQRFFSYAPKLVEAFHRAQSDVKANYLIALGHMLQGVPQEVLLMNLEGMVPLLVESLQQSESLLLITTLDTLQSVLQKPDQALKEHLQTFLLRILALVKFQDSMHVRIKAVQCIHLFCIYPTELILPFKSQVLKMLGECLDDHKRLVRKAAVRARSHWFLVGTSSSRQHR